MDAHTFTSRDVTWSNKLVHTWKLEPIETKHDYTAVIVHGAGTADSSRASGWAQVFADEGIPVISLDFVGHGKSAGKISELSLHKRTQQAFAVINHWISPDQKVLLCGFSMSGHTTLRLTELLGDRVKAISLLCPAIYSKDAEEVTFTEEFTTILRRPESWRDSLALENTKEYKGRVHMMIGAHDPTIPWGVIEALLKSLRENAEEIRLEVVTGVEHKLMAWLSANPERCRDIIRYLVA